MRRMLMSAVAGAALMAGSVAIAAQNSTTQDQPCPQGQVCPPTHHHDQQTGSQGGAGGTQNGSQGGTGGTGGTQTPLHLQGSASTGTQGGNNQHQHNQGNGENQASGNGSTNTQGEYQANNEHGDRHRQMLDVFRGIHISPLPDITFAIDVGTPIPHHVHLHPLPFRIAVIYPEYRHYEYFETADGTIVIVNPHTWRIVDVIRV